MWSAYCNACEIIQATLWSAYCHRCAIIHTTLWSAYCPVCEMIKPHCSLLPCHACERWYTPQTQVCHVVCLLSCIRDDTYYTDLKSNWNLPVLCDRAETGEEPLVESVASLFRELCYSYRDQLSAGILVAGWDKRKGGQVWLSHITAWLWGGLTTLLEYTTQNAHPPETHIRQ